MAEAAREGFFRGLLAGFRLGFPSFISECCFGGIRRSAPINDLVCFSSSSVMSGTAPYFSADKDATRIAPEAFLIEFGQITLGYNVLEEAMRFLFERSSPLTEEYAGSLFHRLSNRDRADLLSAFVKKNEHDENTKIALNACILHYDICTENRNILMHVIYSDISKATSKITLEKRASHDPARKIQFHIEIGDLRTFARDMENTMAFAMRLGAFLMIRARPGEAVGQALLEITPKPRKMIPYQPPEAG